MPHRCRTHLFKYLNGPLRSDAFGLNKLPHPLPKTMTFLNEGIKKLRAIHAIRPQAENLSFVGSFLGNLMGRKPSLVQPLAQPGQTTLWRGMRNMHVAEAFLEHSAGGSEVHLIHHLPDLACDAHKPMSSMPTASLS